MSHRGVVVVMNRDTPDALMLGLEHAGGIEGKGVRPALATALFRDGHLSLVRSARLAGMGAAQFAAHVSRLGIAVVRLDESETVRDLDTLDEWLATS